MAQTKLLGFAPDIDGSTPGIFTDCANIIPTDSGFKAAPAPASANVPALAAVCRGAAIISRLDDTRRAFAGTQTKLYELLSGVWTDRSAGTYAGSTESRWSFAQFGDTTIATNFVDAMQASTSGAFAAIAGAPKAKIVVSAANNFVLAFYTTDGVYGLAPDGWWCSAQNDQTNWTPSIATSANRGRLIGTPGPIQAAATLGDYVIAYKTHGIYLGSYVGAPDVWRWTLIRGSNDAGAVGPEAVCDMGGVHFMVGEDDFWIFDGATAAPVGELVREWFRMQCSETYRYRTRCVWDRQRRLVWICYPSAGSSGALDRALVWHPATKRWGRADFTSEAAFVYIAPGVTIDGLNAYASSIDSLPAVGLDSPFWQTGTRAFAYFDAAHTLMVKNGEAGASSITTWDMGDDVTPSVLRDFRVRFTRAPQTAKASGMHRANLGDSFTPGPVEQMAYGRFDVWQANHWHRLRLDMTGDHAETFAEVTLEPDGGR